MNPGKPRREQRTRVFATSAIAGGVAALLFAAAVLLLSTVRVRQARFVRAEELFQDGFPYQTICPPSERRSYLLRLDLDRVSSAEPGEFRLLLEERDVRNFACLRWSPGGQDPEGPASSSMKRGRLELLRFRDGFRAELSGRAAASLDLRRPSLAPDAGALRLSVRRRPGLWIVSAGREEILSAGDACRGGGPVEWGALSGWILKRRLFQPIEPVDFQDKFSRTSFTETGTYSVVSGKWQVLNVADVKRSVNAFRLTGRGEGAAVLFGHDFWREYRFEVALNFPSDGAAGLIFSARSPDRFGLAKWTRQGAGRGRLEVLDVAEVAGAREERLLASADWVPRKDQWYRMAVSVFHDRGRVEIAGASLDFPLPNDVRSGKCGLYADSERDVFFDDLSVRSHDRVAFAMGGDAPPPWVPSGRRKEFLLPALPDGPVRLDFGLTEGARPFALVWSGSANGREALKERRLEVKPSERRLELAGAALPFSGSSFSVKIGERTVEVDPAGLRPPSLLRRSGCGGREHGVAEAGGESPRRQAPPPERLRPSREGGSRHGDGACSGLLFLAGSPRCGPFELHGSTDGIESFSAGPLGEILPLRRKSVAFSEVDITRNQKGAKIEQKRYEGFRGYLRDEASWRWDESSSTLRQRTLFWGSLDVEAELRVPKEPGERCGIVLEPEGGGPQGKRAVGVVLVKGEKTCVIEYGSGPRPGLMAVSEPVGAPSSAGASEGALRSPGEGRAPEGKPAFKKNPSRAGKALFKLHRRGPFLEAEFGGRRFPLARRLPLWLPVRVAVLGRGVSPDEVRIRGSSVEESLFESAPPEWVRVRGHWEVTVKWQCDRRWTFAGLWSDAEDTRRESALVSSRRPFYGDQDISAYVAMKDMLGGKNKRRYVVRDVNLAFCTRPGDLSSGYCFLMGGFGNRGVQLLKRGKLAAENKGYKLSGNLHWRWWHWRVLRLGRKIRVFLDGKEALSYDDPAPLAGGHVAFWTVGNGMIIGRTRISAERVGEEHADFLTSRSPATSRASQAKGFARLTPGADAGWGLLEPEDSNTLERVPGTPPRVRVTNSCGGGHFAAVLPEPRSISKFLFRATEKVLVSAYADGKGRRKLELPGTRGGSLPADGEWHEISLPKGALKEGERFVIGNWEGDEGGYAAAGIGRNAAGSYYELSLGDRDLPRREVDGAF